LLGLVLYAVETKNAGSRLGEHRSLMAPRTQKRKKSLRRKRSNLLMMTT
jgi:hypothetical protein